MRRANIAARPSSSVYVVSLFPYCVSCYNNVNEWLHIYLNFGWVDVQLSGKAFLSPLSKLFENNNRINFTCVCDNETSYV